MRLNWTAAVGLTAVLCAGALTACTSSSGPRTRWVPKVGATWQYQLSGPVDTSVNASVYDIDGIDTPAAVVAALHAKGRRVICYIDAGSWEDWRPDAGRFPVRVRGNALDGWPGERWLDIRQIPTLKPLMASRFDACRRKGFDGVEADNVDGYTHATGFPLSPADQIAYNKMLAGLAHERGLAIGLKNDLGQVPALVGSFDFAVNEQCHEYNECAALEPFIAAGKPVFHVEYTTSTAEFCPVTTKLRFSSIRKELELEPARQACR